MRGPNPKRIPRTQADVDRAYTQGVDDGIEGGIEMFLYVLMDKHNATQDELDIFAAEVNSLAESIAGGYLSFADVRRVLTDDYGFKFRKVRRKNG